MRSMSAVSGYLLCKSDTEFFFYFYSVSIYRILMHISEISIVLNIQKVIKLEPSEPELNCFALSYEKNRPEF
jgi:hypothetical protein